MNGTSMALGVVFVTLVLDVQAAPLTNHYSSPKECGYEFDYPADWVAAPLPDKELPDEEASWCGVRLRPSDFAKQMEEWDVDVYTLEVAREKDEFLVAAERHGFDFFKGQWVVLGRHGIRSEAEPLVTERWHGLKGDAVVGYYHEGKDGGYAGIYEESRLVLRDEDDNIWAMTGGPQSGRAFDAILATFRFVKK